MAVINQEKNVHLITKRYKIIKGLIPLMKMQVLMILSSKSLVKTMKRLAQYALVIKARILALLHKLNNGAHVLSFLLKLLFRFFIVGRKCVAQDCNCCGISW